MNVFAKNTTASAITVASWTVSYIDSTDAELVEVEGTQPSFIDVWLYLPGTDSTELKTFSANDYWNSRVIDSTDEQTLRDFGVSLVNIGGDPIEYGIDSNNSDFSFAPLGLYRGLRTGDLNADMSNFYVADGDSTWSNRKCIWSISAYSTPALTWKCHITKNSGGAVKYNAFKFTLNGTPYYYVIDGIHDTWTDDLSAWGYSEVQPGPVLPTVSINDDFGGSNWLYLTLYENVQMNAGSVLAPTNTYSYDGTKAYAVVFWQNVYGTNTGSADVGVVDDNGTLKLKNVSTSPIYIKCARVAVCSDSTVGKTIVYDSNGDNHNAFVFNMSGTPYYYVLDGVQTDWTDDLSSIGYTKTVPVSKAGDYGSSNLFTASTSGTSRTLGAGSTGAPYISGTTGSGTYKYSRSYATYYGYETNGGNKIDPTRLGWLNGSGVNALYWQNISASSLTINWAVVALCSNPCADVVPVYNASNVAYNAFHYTENNTDYYYVLDGTQTDWVSDLGSIGYSLTQTLEIILALRYDPSTSQWKTVAFDQTPSATENYWWGCVIDQAGVTALQSIGLTYHDPSSIWGGSKFTGPIGNVVYDSGYSYEVLALYSDMGTTEVAQSLLPSLTLEPLTKDNTDLLVIWSKNVIDTTPVKTWKVRITKL